jgi:hypothetical protein
MPSVLDNAHHKHTHHTGASTQRGRRKSPRTGETDLEARDKPRLVRLQADAKTNAPDATVIEQRPRSFRASELYYIIIFGRGIDTVGSVGRWQGGLRSGAYAKDPCVTDLQNTVRRFVHPDADAVHVKREHQCLRSYARGVHKRRASTRASADVASAR